MSDNPLKARQEALERIYWGADWAAEHEGVPGAEGYVEGVHAIQARYPEVFADPALSEAAFKADERRIKERDPRDYLLRFEASVQEALYGRDRRPDQLAHDLTLGDAGAAERAVEMLRSGSYEPVRAVRPDESEAGRLGDITAMALSRSGAQIDAARAWGFDALEAVRRHWRGG
jgi:hypothetical protein